MRNAPLRAALRRAVRPPRPRPSPGADPRVNDGLLEGRRQRGHHPRPHDPRELRRPAGDGRRSRCRRSLNEEGYANGNRGSVRDYYQPCSTAPDYSNTVVGPCSSSKPSSTTRRPAREGGTRPGDRPRRRPGRLRLARRGDRRRDQRHVRRAYGLRGASRPHNGVGVLGFQNGIRTYFYMVSSMGRSPSTSPSARSPTSPATSCAAAQTCTTTARGTATSR